jgi:plastocyanin
MFSKVFFLALIPAILAADHAVTVGANNALAFSPTSIVAAVGDTITFTVYAHAIYSGFNVSYLPI